jgi:hypothetical protein
MRAVCEYFYKKYPPTGSQECFFIKGSIEPYPEDCRSQKRKAAYAVPGNVVVPFQDFDEAKNYCDAKPLEKLRCSS